MNHIQYIIYWKNVICPPETWQKMKSNPLINPATIAIDLAPFFKPISAGPGSDRSEIDHCDRLEFRTLSPRLFCGVRKRASLGSHTRKHIPRKETLSREENAAIFREFGSHRINYAPRNVLVSFPWIWTLFSSDVLRQTSNP